MKRSTLHPSRDTVLVIQPETHAGSSAQALCQWLHNSAGWLRETLHAHGALLFRGFAIDSTRAFQAVCAEVDDRPFAYVGGESPRTVVSGNVYTSTEYPAKLEITLHNEMSYAPRWPQHLFLCCLQPAAAGGQTPLADSREILRRLPQSVRQRFTDRQVTYKSHYHDGWGLGKSWQQTFQTDSKQDLEQHCIKYGIEYHWSEDGLRTCSIRPATARHPVTGDEVWFNQADRWHVSSRGSRQAEALLRALGEEGLPRHARFGDASEIPMADLEAVHAACRRSEILFDWQRGDVLVLDNMLVAHGRKPFTGERRVVVTLAG